MAGAIIIKILFSTRVMPFFIKTINVQFRYRYLASIFLLLLLPFSFDVLVAVVCSLSCVLLSNMPICTCTRPIQQLVTLQVLNCYNP